MTPEDISPEWYVRMYAVCCRAAEPPSGSLFQPAVKGEAGRAWKLGYKGVAREGATPSLQPAPEAQRDQARTKGKGSTVRGRCPRCASPLACRSPSVRRLVCSACGWTRSP